jgi:hypothetical protein
MPNLRYWRRFGKMLWNMTGENVGLVMKSSILVSVSALIFLNACDTYEHLRSHPPACKSYAYTGFMGHSRDWVVAQAIAERWTFVGQRDVPAQNDPTRIAFYLEGTPEVVAGIGCN